MTRNISATPGEPTEPDTRIHRPDVPPSPPPASGREWNAQFQSLLDRVTDERILNEARVFDSISALATDFHFCAVSLGKIIISEKFLPDAQKTIKPVDMGGVAGGTKYLVNNIIFKFAIDHQGLYGSDESASKAAGQELLGLTYVWRSGLPLHVPLCCLVDYRGFRLVAVCRLPVDSSTLVYGSDSQAANIKVLFHSWLSWFPVLCWA